MTLDLPQQFELGDGGRPWELPAGVSSELDAAEYFLGRGSNALEVAVAIAGRPPTKTSLRELWGKRHAGRPSPVLCVVVYRTGDSWRAGVCGPAGEDPVAVLDLDLGNVRRICETALAEPDRHAATRFLLEALPESAEELPGIRNVGMFATHHLRAGVRERPDWDQAGTAGRSMLAKSGRELIQSLGFEIEERSATANVLRVDGNARAVAVFLDESESPEGASTRFGGSSPATHGLAAADRDGLPYVVLTRGRQIRIYAAGKEAGVGRKGRAETFIEANLALLPDDLAGYLPLLFGAEALRTGGTFEEVLERSRDLATELGVRLRERVYQEVVPGLARAVVEAQSGAGEEDLDRLYQQTLVILFRLLFIAYAEDKELLPYRASSAYQRHSLKNVARELADRRYAGELDFDPHATNLWDEVKQLFAAVHKGNTEWQVPEYNGELFASNEEVSPIGAAIERFELTNAAFGPPLAALLVDRAEDDQFGPVDFRSLSVREFGTIYEGLLESSLAMAGENLAIDADGTFVPTGDGDEVEVEAGTIYLHDRSGARKATGSYFTKPFAVEHLLRAALEPALETHVKRIRALAEAGESNAAAGAFFDFRCADIAMGSGHFLVAAIDQIEARLSTLLAEHPIAEVVGELERLKAAALGNLGELAAGVEIEHASLLRRQVARRCIYGVDRNPIAVELARLALWIHTFVPGLPLSFLDHSLVCGDSLTGIATVEEAAGILEGDADAGAISLLREPMLELLGRAEDALRRLARASDADAREIAKARKAAAEAEEAVQPVRDLYDLLVAVRLGRAERFEEMSEDAVAGHRRLAEAKELARQLSALHFPATFPEVFLRERPGFDCVLGNPPWDKVKPDPQHFWLARSPGLNTLGPAQRDAAIEELRVRHPQEARLEQIEQAEREGFQELVRAAYRLHGVGHYDYAKLFVERALAVLAEGGYLSYVLPRQALVLGGWTPLRQALFEGATTVAVQARNAGGWLFEDVHHSYAVVLLTRCPPRSPPGAGGVVLCPEVTGPAELAAVNIDGDEGSGSTLLDAEEIEQLSDTAVLPWLKGPVEAEVFERIRPRPSLSSGGAWITGHHDARWDFRRSGPQGDLASDSPSPGSWRVLRTRHVDQFAVDLESTATYYVVDPEKLVEISLGVIKRDGTVECGEEHPVVIVRHPSRNDDSRTLIASALPRRGHLYNKGYVHSVSCADDVADDDVLALIGFLNSYCCDWWARRFVDRHVTAPVVNNLRLPEWGEAERSEAADLTAALLKRNGLEELSSGISLSADRSASEMDEEAIRVRLESLAIGGLGLGPEQVAVLLQDFSENGCPPQRREAILGACAQ